MVDQVTFIATRPLSPNSTYTVALLAGIKTAGGADFKASFTWSVVREPDPVVVLDDAGNVVTNLTPLDPNSEEDKQRLLGINLLWNAHHAAVVFLKGTGHASGELLLAFEFNTQTTIDPLDPEVAGSPASTPTALPLLGNASTSTAVAGPRAGLFAQCIPDDPISDTECFLRIALGGGNYAVGKATCAAAGCAAVNDVLGSLVLSKQYQTDVTNTAYTGTGALPIPGAWGDPKSPAVVHDTNNANPLLNDVQARLGALVLIPQGTAPAAGFPVVIFQHGITRSRTDAFGIMGALTSQGFAVVAIDAANHGSRAVRISNTANAIPALDCSDVNVGLTGPRPDRGPDPSAHPGCYAPVLSPDLAATRDGFRQTVLDLQQLVTSLKACGTTLCGKLKVDATKIAYVGHSLVGGNFGAMLVGLTGIRAAVFNAAGAGWLDIIENTGQVAAFQCPLVDGLIDAGFLTGDKFDPVAGTGLCTTDAWKTAAGYRQFAVIGRWVLDPADPANFSARLAPARFLLQRIDGDDVVPNIATDNQGALVQELRGDASCGAPVGASVPPSTALLAAPTQSHFLDYLTIAPGNAACPPGNTFSHGALLQPEPSVLGVACNPGTGVGCDGSLATARLQTDMVFFLLANLDLL
jgi:dienelactone hydrolase